jgi:hypothetical protein
LFIDSIPFANYSDSLFVGDCNNGRLYNFTLSPSRDSFVFSSPDLSDLLLDFGDDSSEIEFGNGFGCITDIEFGPDGFLYVASISDGIIYRILPADSCMVPDSENLIITSTCTLYSSIIVSGNVLVQNNSVLTIPSDVTLDIDFSQSNLTVESGSGVLIKSGGTIKSIAQPDSDSDGVPDASDNCPLIANFDQLDTDLDNTGDACDTDDDNDTIVDVSDNCPLISNLNQNDLDSDGTGDACDSETVVASNTILTADTSLAGDLVVEPGFVLTINPGVTLDIDLVNHKISVKSGGGIFIKSGGTIT